VKTGFNLKFLFEKSFFVFFNRDQVILFLLI
jgi:hypothetical protein